MPDALSAGATRRSWRSVVPAPLRHGVTIFLVLLVIEYFVIPDLVLAGHHLYVLERVNIAYLILGVVLEAASLLCYAQLTRSLLPKDALSLGRIVQIDLSTTAVAHILPGGSAGSASLGYRLFTTSGVKGSDTGFAMATQGMGSAVVLNVLLWLSLVISIPLAGLRPIYVAAALAGMLALLFIAAIVYAFTRGEQSAVHVVRFIGRKIPRLGEERLVELVRTIGTSIRALARDKALLRRATIWAAANWLLDAASLFTFVAAFGHFIDPIELFVAYGVANVLAVIPITPGGLGFVEASSIGLLIAFGVPKPVAPLAVFGWRLVNFWLPIPVGALCYVSLRARRGAHEKRRVLSRITVEASVPVAPMADPKPDTVS